jgi:cell division protein FtsB
MIHNLRQRLRGYWLVCTFAFSLVAIWLLCSGVPTLLEMRQVWLQEAAREQKIRSLYEENTELEQTIEQLNSDATEVERIARQELGWARPGETVIKIPEKE